MDTSNLSLTLLRFISQLASERSGRYSRHLTQREPTSRICAVADAQVQRIEIRVLDTETVENLQLATDTTYGSGVWEVTGGMELRADFCAPGWQVSMPLACHDVRIRVWREARGTGELSIWRIEATAFCQGASRVARRDLTGDVGDTDLYITYRDALENVAALRAML